MTTLLTEDNISFCDIGLSVHFPNVFILVLFRCLYFQSSINVYLCSAFAVKTRNIAIACSQVRCR